jgi:RNA polymerase subunit RPABC4/transcription elongation factor Spt4
MAEDIGIACGRCDTFSPMGTERCSVCANDLALFGRPKPLSEAPPARSKVTTSAPPALEDPMEQTRYYVCKECSTPVPAGHKFCGACGATVPKDVLERKVEFFGSMQAPGKARLILIRGTEGTDGLSYLLQGTEHIAGTSEALIPFLNDPWISAKHANFVYRAEKLIVKDEGSANGVYVRVRQPTPLRPNDQF